MAKFTLPVFVTALLTEPRPNATVVDDPRVPRLLLLGGYA